MKFSEWLKSCGFNHTLEYIKGGWIIRFAEDTDPKFIEFVKTIVVEVHTDETKEVNGVVMGVSKTTNAYTTYGFAIVLEETHCAEAINAIYTQIQNYVRAHYSKQ